MESKFSKRIEEYLSSECDDYGLSYTWQWDDDTLTVEAEITRGKLSEVVSFMYNEKEDDLLIELSEDCFYVTREYDQTVKYFWMLICPSLFPNN